MFALRTVAWSEPAAEAARMIRRVVFVEEQAVPVEEEWDAMDAQCVHLVLDYDGEPAGCARVLPDGHIGRVAVLKPFRGRGAGRRLVQAAAEVVLGRGQQPELGAQTHALGFYESLGFRAHGELFLDAGIDHFNMRYAPHEPVTRPHGAPALAP